MDEFLADMKTSQAKYQRMNEELVDTYIAKFREIYNSGKKLPEVYQSLQYLMPLFRNNILPESELDRISLVINEYNLAVKDYNQALRELHWGLSSNIHEKYIQMHGEGEWPRLMEYTLALSDFSKS